MLLYGHINVRYGGGSSILSMLITSQHLVEIDMKQVISLMLPFENHIGDVNQTVSPHP